MRASLLAGPLAEDVTIAGQPARAFVHRDVELVGEFGQVVGRRTEVEIASGSAGSGVACLVGVQTFVLGAEVADDGLFARFILEPVL